ncbi:hypothetical protein F5B18DRAFT_624365 [Nemania serpens]|nr:hypothetical protein F5B18DRAFT_624365 [Nemania serpens]
MCHQGLGYRVFCFGSFAVALLFFVLPWLSPGGCAIWYAIQRTTDTHTQYEARVHWGRFCCLPCCNNHTNTLSIGVCWGLCSYW